VISGIGRAGFCGAGKNQAVKKPPDKIKKAGLRETSLIFSPTSSS
jgi:hypothetical protein